MKWISCTITVTWFRPIICIVQGVQRVIASLFIYWHQARPSSIWLLYRELRYMKISEILKSRWHLYERGITRKRFGARKVTVGFEDQFFPSIPKEVVYCLKISFITVYLLFTKNLDFYLLFKSKYWILLTNSFYIILPVVRVQRGTRERERRNQCLSIELITSVFVIIADLVCLEANFYLWQSKFA